MDIIKRIAMPEHARIVDVRVQQEFMGERTVSLTVHASHPTPSDFDKEWVVAFGGEGYVMPLRSPQASKDNERLDSVLELTFHHRAIHELKRWLFFTVPDVVSGVAVADKYIASVSLSLGDFCELYGLVLRHYYGDSIIMDLNPKLRGGVERKTVSISNSYMWDVLLDVFKVYGVTWRIEPCGDIDHYVIKVGYGEDEIGHVFEYGFEGGLLKVERQVQDENIRNMLLGRGGQKNLPFRYFKDVDPANRTFRGDPDWIPELRNVYFAELRGKTFRDYVKGWKTNPRRQLTEADGSPIRPYSEDGEAEPIRVEPYDAAYGESSFAYRLGHTDESFDPVEYVRDDGSVERYGPLLGGLDNNEDIFPTLQGVTVEPYGRLDEAVDVEQVADDDVEGSVEESGVVDTSLENCREVVRVKGGVRVTGIEIVGPEFTVAPGKRADLDVSVGVVMVVMDGQTVTAATHAELTGSTVVTVTKPDGTGGRSASAIPEGKWRYKIVTGVHNMSDSELDITVGAVYAKLTESTPSKRRWSNTFDIWIKNVFGTTQGATESDAAYVDRVWGPVLGDRDEGEAKVVFSDGMLSMSEDYEFVIVKGGIEPDDSRVLGDCKSHWRLRLVKSEADLESTGLYVPSQRQNGKAGDHFYFIGIDAPHLYTTEAERRLDMYKEDCLLTSKDANPTRVVTLDKVRMANEGRPGAILDMLSVGRVITLRDTRFTGGNGQETLYIKSLSYAYGSGGSDSLDLIPDVEIVLSTKYEMTANPVATMRGDIDELHRQFSGLAGITQLIRTVGDCVYLRKDGVPDRSVSPTDFVGNIGSHNFRSGLVGGAGWGIFRDEDGSFVLETDRLNVRKDLAVSTLVVNHAEARGGMIIESAAALEITDVQQLSDGDYRCFFDRRGGSVANLFVKNDIALCQRFTADNKTLKYYRREVVSVEAGSVTLSDTNKDGHGVPSKGDVIIHYGNTKVESRRYVKVRDVVGGGYERYLEGLDSVSSAGVEYYFVGRQSGNAPRWFIGDKQGFIKYEGRKLSIKAKIDMESPFGDTTLGQYIDDIPQRMGGGTNMVRNSDFIDGDARWSCNIDNVVNFAPSDSIDGSEYLGRRSVMVNRSGLTSDNTVRMAQYIDFAPGRYYTLSFYAYVPSQRSIDGTADVLLDAFSANGQTLGAIIDLKAVPEGEWTFCQSNFFVKAGTTALAVIARMSRNGLYFLNSIKCEEGQHATSWSPSPKDTNYLRSALQGSTSVNGGLILATLLKLGTKDRSGSFVPMSGLNGAVTGGGGDPALWAGGDMVDAANPGGQKPATAMIRQNGTAYFCENTVRLTENEIEVGDYVALDKAGLRLFKDTTHGEVVLRVTNESVGTDFPAEGATNVFTPQSSTSSVEIGKVRAGLGGIIPAEPYFVATGYTGPEYSIGNLSKGTTIKVSADVSVGFSASGADVNRLDGSVFCEVYRKSGSTPLDVVSRTMALSSQSGSFGETVAINTVVEKAGTYYVRWGVKASGKFGDTAGSASVSVKPGICRTESVIKSQTILGNDGLLSAWGNAALLVRDNVAGFMCGNYGLRVTASGIQATETGSGGWATVKLLK